jgi:hypothetical protein
MVLEKATLAVQVEAWTDVYGLPVVALRGYASTPLITAVAAQVERDGRKAVALYLGDLDPSGMSIEEVFFARTDCFDDTTRLVVRPEQVAQLSLVAAPGKGTDPRAAGFVASHGELIQVEVEAIDPVTLRVLVLEAVRDLTDETRLAEVLDAEDGDRAVLEAVAVRLGSHRRDSGPPGSGS